MRWMCSRRAGGEGYLSAPCPHGAIEWESLELVISSALVKLRKRPNGASFRVLNHWSAGCFHAFSRAA